MVKSDEQMGGITQANLKVSHFAFIINFSYGNETRRNDGSLLEFVNYYESEKESIWAWKTHTEKRPDKSRSKLSPAEWIVSGWKSVSSPSYSVRRRERQMEGLDASIWSICWLTAANYQQATDFSERRGETDPIPPTENSELQGVIDSQKFMVCCWLHHKSTELNVGMMIVDILEVKMRNIFLLCVSGVVQRVRK